MPLPTSSRRGFELEPTNYGRHRLTLRYAIHPCNDRGCYILPAIASPQAAIGTTRLTEAPHRVAIVSQDWTLRLKSLSQKHLREIARETIRVTSPSFHWQSDPTATADGAVSTPGGYSPPNSRQGWLPITCPATWIYLMDPHRSLSPDPWHRNLPRLRCQAGPTPLAGLGQTRVPRSKERVGRPDEDRDRYSTHLAPQHGREKGASAQDPIESVSLQPYKLRELRVCRSRRYTKLSRQMG